MSEREHTIAVKVSDDAYISLLIGLGGAFTDTPTQGRRDTYLLPHYPSAAYLHAKCVRVITHEALKWA